MVGVCGRVRSLWAASVRGPMTVDDVSDVVAFLMRVVPRGEVEAERLGQLLRMLDSLLPTR